MILMKIAWLMLAFAAALSGCDLWLNVNTPQCKIDQDCVQLLGREFVCGAGGVCSRKVVADAGSDASTLPPLPSRWACIRQPVPTFVPDDTRLVTVRLDAVEVDTLKVPDGLVSSACAPEDVSCSNPLASNVMPDSDGFLQYTVPYGFEGFLTFDAPNIVHSLSYANRAYTDNTTTSGPALSTPSSLNDVSSHSDMPVMPGDGIAFIEVRDCNDAAGDGVQFAPIGDKTPFYFDGALPSRDLDRTTISNVIAANREARAVGGFSDLTPGFHTMIAIYPQTGETIGKITVQILANNFTYVRIYAGYDR